MRSVNKYAFLVTLIAFTILLSCKKEKIEVPPNEEHDYSGLSDIEKLGKKIFFDKGLSSPAGQSCASCHALGDGFTDPSHLPFSKGAISSLIGDRNAPSIAYMKYAPSLYFDNVDSTYVGGLFWDGRVNSLEAQAIKPMLNPIEMNNPNIATIVNKIKNAEYSDLFRSVFGNNVFNDTTTAINSLASAIAAYEKSDQVNPFTSKYDYYLKGKAVLSAQELRGLKLFNDTAKAKCANCHPSTNDNSFGLALFTDFTYDNIGVPHNPSSPNALPDLGLGKFLNDTANNGRFKVPTLRNVALTAPYFHNGYFKTLEDVVRFYSDRDSVGMFDPPEVLQHVNRDELGKLNLSEQDVQDIVAFLKTLSDGRR